VFAVVCSEAREWLGDAQDYGDLAVLQWQPRLPPQIQDLSFRDPTVVEHRA